jgi:hypothetical protein
VRGALGGTEARALAPSGPAPAEARVSAAPARRSATRRRSPCQRRLGRARPEVSCSRASADARRARSNRAADGRPSLARRGFLDAGRFQVEAIPRGHGDRQSPPRRPSERSGDLPCFAHGQLYVASSRVGHPGHIRFALEPDASGAFKTPNVVYQEALSCSDEFPTDAALDVGEDWRDCNVRTRRRGRVATRSQAGGASGMHIDRCASCRRHASVDAGTALCVPCESQMDE